MATDQVRVRSLYAGLYRTVTALGVLLAAAWLFALLSFYLSRTTGADWFARSGSVMALAGAAATFRLANFYQRATREGAQRRPRIGAQRNRASPRTAEIVYGAFVSRLSHWHRGYWDLGLWGPAGPTDLLSPPRAFRSGMDDGDISTVNEEKQRCSLP